MNELREESFLIERNRDRENMVLALTRNGYTVRIDEVRKPNLTIEYYVIVGIKEE